MARFHDICLVPYLGLTVLVSACAAPSPTPNKDVSFRQSGGEDEHRVGCFVINAHNCKGEERLLGAPNPDLLYQKEQCRDAILGSVSAYLATIRQIKDDPLAGAKLIRDTTRSFYSVSHNEVNAASRNYFQLVIRPMPFVVSVTTEIRDSDDSAILIDSCDQDALNAADEYAITQLYRGVLGAINETLKEDVCFGPKYSNPDFAWLEP